MAKKPKPKSIADIISVLGGPTATAASIGTSQPNVQGMKERGSIPPKWWPDLIAALRRVNVRLTADDLLQMMTKNKH